MAVYHLVLRKEAAWGTYLAPTTAYPAESAEVLTNFDFQDQRLLGSGPALRDIFQGAMSPTGSISGRIYEELFGLFLNACCFNDVTTITPVGATNARQHAFLIDDNADPDSLSGQLIQDGSNMQAFRGAQINSLTVSVQAGQPAEFSADLLIRDETITGQTWGNGDAAPAVATPSYFDETIGLLHYASCALIVGGTVAIDGDNDITISGGTTLSKVDMAEISIENNYSFNHHLGSTRLASSRTRQERTVSGRMDIDFSAFSDDDYVLMKNATRQAVQLTLTGQNIEATFDYTIKITLPYVQTNLADIVAITGDQGRRVQSVEFRALLDSATTNTDIGVTVIDTQTAY